MDELIRAMGPAFAAGLAVQRLVDLTEPITKNLPAKKLLINILAVLVGVWLALEAKLGVLAPLGADVTREVDVVVTGLIVSAGTDGFNSLFKFLGYAKETKKDQAGVTRAEVRGMTHAQALSDVQAKVG